MKINLLAILLVLSTVCRAQQRCEIVLDDHWLFSHDKQNWEQVSIPHDWAIQGPFDKKWDLQRVAITQNGEKVKSEKSGRSGALPWIGEGYYKTTFRVPENKTYLVIHLDGAMSEPTVYVNGHRAGHWAYGYNAFRVNATPYLNANNRENTLEVSLRNREESSRWYPGAGLYRPVTLIFTDEIHINRWGTYLHTLTADDSTASVAINTHIDGYELAKAPLSVQLIITDTQGIVVAKKISNINRTGDFRQLLNIKNPQLWSPESPYLYKVTTRLYQDKKLIDVTTDPLGIRTLQWGPKGFELNGKVRKLQGVCLHHDLGPLGAAVNKAALIRQIRILKEMGCDAIRTAHNMPSTMQMNVCDSLGMMVMAESFDMWIYPKCKNGYALFFKEWADRDITNLILNHRNHPSIVMWSIGNEIPEQWSTEGRDIARHLQDICHQLDPSRPVTQGMDRAEKALHSGFAQVMDIPGFNYRINKYDTSIKALPQGFLLGAETASTVSSRGVYKFPVKITDRGIYPDGQCSSYDTEYCRWSNLPDADFIMQDDRPWSIGQFVWTGFDYLGEPTPYDSYWPSRSSYFGICDLAGLPKDRYYLYRSVWNKQQHTIHLLPHWTWPGREGKKTPVYCYTDYPSAELFINGKSQGRRTKQAYKVTPATAEMEKVALKTENMLDRYRLRWNDVLYTPGELRVVTYDTEGHKTGERSIRTAGKPSTLRLEADRNHLIADGYDLAFVTVSLRDNHGTLIPEADDELNFDVSGAGRFKAVCNGDATSLDSFTEPKMKLFNGQLVVIVQTTKIAGTIKLTVRDKKMKLKSHILIKSMNH